MTAYRLTLLILVLGGCKPEPASRIFSIDGGTRAAWGLTPTLTARGADYELQLKRTGSGATESKLTFTRVDLEVAGPPDGIVEQKRVVAKRWIALAEGSQHLTFNVLATTEASGLCYVNDSKLSGVNEPVYCKPATDAGSEAATVLGKLREVCGELAKLPIDPAEDRNFARLDANDNDACICLNGNERKVRYDAYQRTDPKDAAATFEVACKRRERAPPETLSEGDKNYNACVEVTAYARWKLTRTDVVVGVTSCGCVAARLNYFTFSEGAAAFTKECRRLAGIREPDGDPSSTQKPELDADAAARVQAMKKECTSYGLADKGSYCDCPAAGAGIKPTADYASYQTVELFKADRDQLLCD